MGFMGTESKNIKLRLGHVREGAWREGQGVERAQHSSPLTHTGIYHREVEET